MATKKSKEAIQTGPSRREILVRGSQVVAGMGVASLLGNVEALISKSYGMGPAATNLLGAHVEFTSPDEPYADLSDALLASRLKSSIDGYQFEQQEIWSDRGDLLVDAQIVRRQERPALLGDL